MWSSTAEVVLCHDPNRDTASVHLTQVGGLRHGRGTYSNTLDIKRESYSLKLTHHSLNVSSIMLDWALGEEMF